jgi:aminopeptidase YwaD
VNQPRANGPTRLAMNAIVVVVLVLGSGFGPAQAVPGAPDPLAGVPGLALGVQSITAQEFGEQLAWWAHDDRGGREPGTPGSVEAGNVAAAEFQRLGLEPLGDEVNGRRTFFQNFERGGKHGFRVADTVLRVGKRTFELKRDFALVGRTDESKLENLPVVFVGYGIQSSRRKYDDYERVKVRGKAILIFNYEPQEKDPNSAWNGDRLTSDASMYRKVRHARREGVRLILMVDGPLCHDPAKDPLTGQESGSGVKGITDATFASAVFSSRECPLLHVRRDVADALLAGSGRTLEDLQRRIDEKGAPASFALGTTVSFRGKRELIRPARNIIARFPGSDRRLGNEVIVIGAHYDHLGLGNYGSRSPGRRGEIHNGADDNATGTVGVLELAEAFAESGVKTRRSILFVLFDAEEKGLYGSMYFVENPPVPLQRIAAMINMDMIGYVRDNRMSISGTGTCKDWDGILPKAEFGSPLAWSHRETAFGGSDHLSFVGKHIPVLMFNSGLHAYYHTPDDDADRCNPDGAQEVLRVMFRIAYLAADLPRKPEWTAPGPDRRAGGNRPELGVAVRTDSKLKGARITDVIADTPAARAGLRLDDVILKIGKSRVTGRLALGRALRGVKPGETIPVEVVRGTAKMTIQVTFPEKGGPKPRK